MTVLPSVEAVYVDTHVAVRAGGRWTLLAGRGDPTLSGQRLYSDLTVPPACTDAARVFDALRASGTLQRLVGEGDRRRAVSVSGHQPSYHPYLPLLAKAAHADVFSFADDMAFGRQTFQHRQRVPGANGPIWITVPVQASPSRTAIGDKLVSEHPNWRRKHWELIQRGYGHLPYFSVVGDFLEQVYASEWTRLAALDHALWLPLQRLLAPATFFMNATLLPFDRSGRKGDRIAAELQLIADGGVYLCGAAADYLDRPSDRDPSRTYADAIRDVGFGIVQCTLARQSSRTQPRPRRPLRRWSSLPGRARPRGTS